MAADRQPRGVDERSFDATEAIVESVGFEVAHDSDGLLVVGLRYPNGGRSQLQLEGRGVGRLLATLGLEAAQDLVGRRFSELAPGLPVNGKS